MQINKELMFKLTGFIITALFLLTIAAVPACAGAEAVTVGMYGAPSIKSVNPDTYLDNLNEAGVNAVFVPDDEETIRWFKSKGYKVFISMNVFGGTGAWKNYPDSRPVKENGELLEEGKGGYGGICPTHEGWRKERLDYIEGVLKRFGGKEGIDGIWLDFIRYPGTWEAVNPEIPDTCYCKRCQRELRIANCELRIDEKPNSDETNVNARLRFSADCHMKWKKKQIASFVIDAKRIVERYSKERPIKLGLFIVPWTKGERQNDISFKIAQDAFELSKHADVISPMVYHRMCGQDESWVGRMTEYYKETASCEVWPIVQSHDCKPGEFTNVVKYAGEAGADGILVYSFGGMKPDLWNGLKAFKKPLNLLPVISYKGSTAESSPQPASTTHRPSPITHRLSLIKTFDHYYMRDVYVRKLIDAVGVRAEYGTEGKWEANLPKCKPGQEYLFTGLFYRDKFENGVYADVSIWGRKFHIDEHLWAGTFQPIRAYVTCPDKIADQTFKFINSNPGTIFYMAKPELSVTTNYSITQSLIASSLYPSAFNLQPSASSLQPAPMSHQPFFPIGVYGANLSNLEEIKQVGINTVIIGGKGEELRKLIRECRRLGLKYILSVPHDPDALHVYLNEIKEDRVQGVEGSRVQGGEGKNNLKFKIKNEELENTKELPSASSLQPPASHLPGFYVNDEPEIVSFPMNKANDIRRLIKDRFPEAAAYMAVVRPQKVRDYASASDFFMMDQYPVPSMPMVWLSDSMDEAAAIVGRERIVSVIQAFGGGEEAKHGWPRMPTREEIECLTFLSIVHGSKGIFFFTFSKIGNTEEGRKDLAHVVGRLNKVGEWLSGRTLLITNHQLRITILSPYGMDQKGRPAIHAAVKTKGSRRLLIAVNTIGTNVEALIHTNTENIETAREIFSENSYSFIGGAIQARFKPYEVKAFVMDEAGN